MKKINTLWVFFPLFFLLSCNGDQKKLINTYKLVEEHSRKGEYNELFELLDKPSKTYLKYLADTTNHEQARLARYGREFGVKLNTLVTYREIGEALGNSKDPETLLLLYYSLSGLPVLSWIQPPKLLEDQTETAKGNYVTVATKVGDKTFITSKVHFTKYKDGSQRLDLLELLKYRERILSQQYEQMVHEFDEKRKLMNLPQVRKDLEGKDPLEYFLENRSLPENQLQKIFYRKGR